MCLGARRLLYHNRHMSCGWPDIPCSVHHSHREKVTRFVYANLSSMMTFLTHGSYSSTSVQVAGCHLRIHVHYGSHGHNQLIFIHMFLRCSWSSLAPTPGRSARGLSLNLKGVPRRGSGTCENELGSGVDHLDCSTASTSNFTCNPVRTLGLPSTCRYC